MSKLIRMPDDQIEILRAQFEAALALTKRRTPEGEFRFSYKLPIQKTEKARLIYTPAAWLKQRALIDNFSTEVAWHGVVHKNEDGAYIVTDILIYPQTVSGATVDADDEKYPIWLQSQPDEVFFNCRLQGHSHVNMAVSPSGTDLKNNEDFLKQLKDDMFYIFIISNKAGAMNVKIYDLAENILYETEDVIVSIQGDGIDMSEFVKQAKDFVTTKTYTTGFQTAGGTYKSGSAVVPIKDGKKDNKEKPSEKSDAKIGKGWNGKDYGNGRYRGYDCGYEEDYDYDNPWSSAYYRNKYWGR